MTEVNAPNGTNAITPLLVAGRAIRVAAAPPVVIPTTRHADAISFSHAAQRLRAGQPAAHTPATPPTYGFGGSGGLQATTSSAARQALGQLVAARVPALMDFQAGQVPARSDALPFYTNPALANTAATRASAARLGTGIDATG